MTQKQFICFPEFLVEEVSRSTASAVTGKCSFATVGIEDSDTEIRSRFQRGAHNSNAISPGAVMPVADSAAKIAETGISAKRAASITM